MTSNDNFTSPSPSTNDPDVLRAEIDQTRANLSQNVNALGEAVQPGNIARRQASKATGAAVGLRDKVMGTAHDTTSAIGDHASGLGDSASGMASGMASTAADVPGQARRKAQGNPLAAGLVALSAGWLVGSLMPSSQKEREAAQAVKDQAAPLVEKGKDAGKEAAQHLQQPAQDAADAVKTRAQEAVGAVKDEGQQRAADVQESAAESRQAVQDHQSRPETSL